jgi:hypothetical protein
MSTLYFYIGLSKTGSTFLQQNVFSKISSTKHLGKPVLDFVDGKNPWDGILKRYFERSPLIWRDLGEKLFRELFGPVRAGSQVEDVLITDENACSYREPALITEHLSGLKDVANQWGFERVRVIGSVRHQASRLASSYAQGSDRRVGVSQDKFEQRVRRRIGPDYYQSGIKLEYDLLWQALVDVVGEENTLLLPYELMNESLPDFLRRYFSFLERPEEGSQIIEEVETNSDPATRNVRSNGEDTWALQDRTMRGVKTIQLRPSRLFTALGIPSEIPLRWPDFERENRIRLDPSLKREVMSTYEESNRALAEHIEMDLGRYDYY